jgi:hypothetical protein
MAKRENSRFSSKKVIDLDATHAKLLQDPLSLLDKSLLVPEGMR